MAITEEQRLERKNHLGSSDMASLLGCNPFQTSGDVYLSKSLDLEDLDSDIVYVGNKLEGGVLDYAEDNLGPLKRDIFVPYPGDLPIASNLDARVIQSGNPVEAKTSGLSYKASDDWGDEGTDQVPNYVIVQCQVHLMCTGADMCHVPALLGGRLFVMFQVAKNDELIEQIKVRADEFWSNYVLKGVMPPDDPPQMEVLKRVVRQPNKSVDVDPDLIQIWEDAREKRLQAVKEAIEDEESAKSAVIAALGDAEQGNMKGRTEVVTYMQTKRRGYTVEPKSYRQLKLKKK